jgi:hypothetical protein
MVPIACGISESEASKNRKVLRHRICLTRSLRDRTERGVYAASTWRNPFHVMCCPDIRKEQTVMRPDRRRAEAALWRAAKAEGRALVPILVGALNTYPVSCRGAESEKCSADETSAAPSTFCLPEPAEGISYCAHHDKG